MQPIKVELDQATREFYVQTLTVLNDAGVPYLIGGAYAMGTLAGIERHTKDIDVFARDGDRDQILQVLEAAGYRTEVTFPHWLAKAWIVERFVDVIYSSGNGVCPRQRRMVRARRGRRVARHPGPALPARGDHLVQVVRPGARAVRRRRHRPPDPSRAAGISTGTA